jgi:lactoylglutathione lyase
MLLPALSLALISRSSAPLASRWSRAHLPAASVALASRLSGGGPTMSTSASTTIPDVSAYMSASRPAETKDYIMQQTMIRVKDPIRSLDFYTKVLGMKLLMAKDFPQWGFSVYFVAPSNALVPAEDGERWRLCMTTPGCIELTWNHGSETVPFKVYNTGNSDATGAQDGQPIKGGFGHIGITTPCVYAACERFKQLGVEFQKSPNQGGMKGLAFVKDPDGYLVEVLPQAYDPATGAMPTQPLDCLGVALEGGEGYKDNSKAK